MRKLVFPFLLTAPLPLLGSLGCGAAAPTPTHSASAAAIAPLPAKDEGTCTPLAAEPSTEILAARFEDERSALEAALREGPVGVRLEGCRMVIVEGCALRAKAEYTPDPDEEEIELATRADVEEELPRAAGRLGKQVEGGRKLEASLRTAGRFSYTDPTAAPDATEACKDATHLVRSYTVGAFALLEAQGAVLEAVGDRSACANAGASAAPPAGCSALVSVDLVPFGEPPVTDSRTRGVTMADTPEHKPDPMKDVTKTEGGGPVETETFAEGGGTHPDFKAAEDAAQKSKGQARPATVICDPRDPLCVFSRETPPPSP